MIDFILSMALLIVSIQTSMFLAQCLFAYRRINVNKDVCDARATLLIPAHNEEAVISRTLSSLRAQLGPGDDILVVADNCSDKTASIVSAFAEESGLPIHVIERSHQTLRGKGFALDFGIQHLTIDPPEIVIIIDADCVAEAEAISLLKQQCMETGKPVQSNYLIEQANHQNIVGKISAFALVVKNVVRQKGMRGMNLPCIMVGAGMAFPWEAIRSIQLASGNIVEDMQMGVDLAIAGYEPIYCHQSRIRSVLPDHPEVALKQRKRWEHGHMQTLLTQVPRLLGAAVRQRRATLLGHALDLSLPPLSLFFMVWAGLTLTALVLSFFGAGNNALMLGGFAGIELGLAAALAWIGFGREVISVTELIRIPMYMLWKIPLYLGFIFNREKQWVRTDRDEERD